MKGKMLAGILAAAIAVGLLSGCTASSGSEKSSGETKETLAETANEVKPAMLLSGSANDHSWNQFGYEALMKAQEELGIETAYSENVTTADQLQAIRDYASKGYNPIIGHGGQFEDDMIKVSEEFPDTQFLVICGGTGADPNVLAADNAPWQYGYAYGWISAQITQTGKVGFITGMEGVSVMNNLVGSWRDGAKTVNPDVETTVVYISDMNDVAEAREAAISLQAAGCDVILHELNAGTQGVIDVCAEKDICTLGRNEADVEYASDQILTYTDYNWGAKYVDLIQKVMDGELQSGTYFYGFHTTEGSGFTFNYDEEHAWNPRYVSEELLTDFDREVVEMFIKEPERSYTVEDAASGTQ